MNKHLFKTCDNKFQLSKVQRALDRCNVPYETAEIMEADTYGNVRLGYNLYIDKKDLSLARSAIEYDKQLIESRAQYEKEQKQKLKKKQFVDNVKHSVKHFLKHLAEHIGIKLLIAFLLLFLAGLCGGK